jgi:two-component sensor histidine kinase
VVHRPSAGTGRFAVCLWALPGRLLRITVHDDGGGPMVPPAVGEGSLGLGLPTIASVARAVELRRADGGGLELVMVFALAQSKLL